jgi:hypothetical protein
MLVQSDESRAELLMSEAEANVKTVGNSTSKWQPCNTPSLMKVQRKSNSAKR